MQNSLLSKYSGAVPRYTSYPTAPHFHEDIDCGKYAQWLQAITGKERISLYIHVPYCDRLCWFCGCHTKQVLRYDPIAAYLPALHRETDTVAEALDGRGHVTALHLGGGFFAFGEVGLAGEVRPAPRGQDRLKEAAKLGFSVAVVPKANLPRKNDKAFEGLTVHGVDRIEEAMELARSLA